MTGGEIGGENVINILKPEGTLTVHVLCCLTAKKKNSRTENQHNKQHWSKHVEQVLSCTVTIQINQTFVSLLFPHSIGVYGTNKFT